MNRFDDLRKEIKSNIPTPKMINITDINFGATTGDFLQELVRRVRETPLGKELDDYVELTAERFFELIRTTKPDSRHFLQLDWLLNNLDYITTLINVFSRNKGIINNNISLTCNELYYDYATQINREPDRRLLGAYMTLVRVVNSKLITVLSAVVPVDTAINLAAAANSSTSDEVRIRRVNWIIVQNGPGIMTPNTICGIYEALFNHMAPLFTYTMMDVCDDPADPDDIEPFDQVNSNIDLALLAELNEMPIESIKQVLFNYASVYTSRINSGAKFRFRIEALNSQQYGRILMAISQIKNTLAVYGFILP